MAFKTELRLYENATVVDKSSFTGNGTESFRVLTGSRMLVVLRVHDIDPGATVNVTMGNAFEVAGPYDGLDTLSLNTAGVVKHVLSDFNNLFQVSYSVTGGNATFKVAVALFDNSLSTRIQNASVEVDLSHTLDANGQFDSVRVGDGTYLMKVNADGSINIVLIDALDEQTKSVYNEQTAVVAGVPTSLVTYTVPAGKVAFLNRVRVSGDNIAEYTLLKNGNPIDKVRTHYAAGLNETFEFLTNTKRGLMLQAGDIISVSVNHYRPAAGTFDGRIQVLEKG